MSKIVAGITISVDGYITGPDDGPGCGLGVGGERLHYWVFGGPWSYESSGQGEAYGEDKAYLDEMTGANGAVIAGRGTYEAAGAWGGANPWDVPLFVVTHRAGDKQVMLMGGADLIRQALAAGSVDELTVIVAPVVLGGGKRLFDGFSQSLDLEHLWVRQSPFATFIHYRVKR
jgi:dihydrofolate reductase